MPRAFLFDIGNVIVRFDFTRAWKLIAEQSDLTEEAEVIRRFEAVKHEYEDGKISRTAFLESAFRILNFRGTDEHFINAWQGIFWPNEPMHDLVRKLHGRYPLYLLSNTNDLHVEVLFRDYDLFNLFDGAVYSHAVSASKPHPSIYEIAQRQLGLVPAETLFIDDLAANIETARQLGFQVHHYHHERHEALLGLLSESGALVISNLKSESSAANRSAAEIAEGKQPFKLT